MWKFVVKFNEFKEVVFFVKVDNDINDLMEKNNFNLWFMQKLDDCNKKNGCFFYLVVIFFIVYLIKQIIYL